MSPLLTGRVTEGESCTFVVIVNFRTGPLVVDCLASLATQRQALRGGRVIVVDNASGDGSAQMIRAAVSRSHWEEWVEILELPRNGGFAYGNNAGIGRVREIDASFAAVVLLNPDTVVVPGALDRLLSFLSAHPEAGIAGALIEDGRGFVETSAHSDPSPRGELHGGAQLHALTRWLPMKTLEASKGPQQCDWVSGACMAVKREVLDAVGPLDEAFFLYFEEVDYCVRARKLGWQCWYVPQARVVHFEGASTGIKTPARRRPPYWYASRRRFFVKRYGVPGLMAADLLWALGRASLVTRRFLGLGGRSGIDSEPARVASDLLLGDVKALINGELRGIRQHG